MELNELKNNICLRQEIEILKKNVKEYVELIAHVSESKQIDFYRYNYEYDAYDFDFSISEEDDVPRIKDTNKHFFILRTNNITLGKIVYKDEVKITQMIEMLIGYVKDKLFDEHTILKQYKNDESSLNIYVVANENAKLFSKHLQSDVSVIFNANVIYTKSLAKIAQQVESKSHKNIILYIANDYEQMIKDEELLKSFNDYIIVYGPNEHKISLLCGSLDIQHYISFDSYTKENLKELILETKHMILNKFHSSNNILSISGISGGVGCTTIAMNMANILATQTPNQNILFIDLSHTKAISNLFLEQNPLPEKTIVDLVNSDEFDLENNLQNGLVRLKENFYSINGIQKHIDKEYLEKDIFIEKFLNYLEMANEYFNIIVIDTGEFEASNLKTTIYDISNEIELITEMNLPHISKLKTLYSLIKRAGLKEKLSFIVNRFDAKNSLSLSDIVSILNITDDDKTLFNYKISNDYITLGKYWNQCELVSSVDENSLFVKEITNFLIDKKILTVKNVEKKKKGFFSMLKEQL